METEETPVPSPRGLTRDDVQQRVEELVATDGLDKSAALTVTRLFHAMDLLLERAKHERDSEVQRLQGELEHAQLQSELDRLTRASADAAPPLTKSTRRKVF